MFGTNDINICMNQYYVYIYYDPITNLPFYVGKGKKDRMYHHLKETAETTDNKKKFNYINKLRKNGITPIVIKFKEDMADNDAYDLEEELISKFGRKGFESYGILTNICLGSRPPVTTGKDHHNFGKGFLVKHTDETKKKISESKKGQRSWHKGRTKSEETRATMSSAQKGRLVTEETKEKLRQLTQEKNSQFGSIWITDGNTNMKIKKDASVPEGWSKGRTFKEGYKHVRN